MDLKFDLTHVPTVIDGVHVGLGLLVLVLIVVAVALARRDKPAEQAQAQPQPESEAARQPAAMKATTPDSALQLLGLFQQDGRLIDFLKEDLGSFSDADIGAAARVVHEGARKTLDEHFDLTPIREEEESSPITVEAGFDATAIRLTGNVVGEAPFKGTLVHKGWRAADVRLPKITEGHDVTVLQPAEVEL